AKGPEGGHPARLLSFRSCWYENPSSCWCENSLSCWCEHPFSHPGGARIPSREVSRWFPVASFQFPNPRVSYLVKGWTTRVLPLARARGSDGSLAGASGSVVLGALMGSSLALRALARSPPPQN